MSIEKLLEENTAALREMIEVTRSLIELRTEAIETVKNSAAPASGGKAAASKKATASAKAEEPKVEEPKADESAYDEAKSLVAEYTTGSDRPEEQQARKAKVKELLRHEKLVKPEMAKSEKFSVTDVMDDKIGVLIKNLKALIERGDITSPAADDDLV